MDTQRAFHLDLSDFKDKLTKQLQVFESEVKIQVAAMKMAIERSQTAEDRYMARVEHLTQELKRVDYGFEVAR